MMRSLWSAASGMNAQQMNVDVIANNLANVNTIAFKKERIEFKSLLYDTMQRATLDRANATGRPVNLQVGLGVRPIAVTRVFTQGNVQETNILTDFAIEGDGFFMIQYKPDTESDNIGYTRDGSFKLGRVDDGLMLLTSEGYLVLDINQQPIIFPDEIDFSRVVVTPEGIFQFFTEDGEIGDLDAQLGVVRFMNPQGLEAIGGNLLIQTSASGEAMLEIEGDFVSLSRIRQGVIEMSNVSVADEMVNLITAQRAYDLNSKAIQASDEMLQTANNLRR